MSPAQRVRPAHDRRQLAGLHELLQDEQVLSPRALHAQADPPRREQREQRRLDEEDARGGRTCAS